MHPYKLTYYIYSTAHALGTCTEHVTSSEDTRDVTYFINFILTNLSFNKFLKLVYIKDSNINFKILFIN